MSSVLFLFVGGSVDYVRYNALRADLLESLDAASLAVVRMEEVHSDWSDVDLVEYGEKFFVENSETEGALLKSDHTPYASIGDVVMFDLVSDETKVKACVDGSIETHLLAVVNIKYFEISQCSTITKAGAGRVELALVLDMTTSMKTPPGGLNGTGDTKLHSLQEAVTSMLDAMFGDEVQSDNLKIGVVPFNAYVNPGKASSWDPSWGDLNAEAHYHGARFVHIDENGFMDLTTKVNHYKLYDSDDDSDWTGCVESRPFPLDELDTPPGMATSTSFLTAAMTPPSSADEPDAALRDAFVDQPSLGANISLTDLAGAASTRFVPIFYGDDPDCVNNGGDRCADRSSQGLYWLSQYDLDIMGYIQPYYYYRNLYSRPRTAGFTEDQYFQRDYIDDELYIGAAAGEPGASYARALKWFHLLDGNSMDPVTQQRKEYMIGLGVRADGFVDDDASADPLSQDDLDYDEFIFRSAYVGWWDPVTQTYKHKYNLDKTDETLSPSPPNCSIPLLPMTDDRLAIDGGDANGDGFPDGGIVGNLYATGDTNIPNGAMWGWRVVSDGLPFTESTGPSDTGPNGTSEGDWRRAVVIMTDGENTIYNRDTHRKTTANSYGYGLEERMGDGINTNVEMQNEMDNKLLRICRRMKQENIEVYSVVFDVTTGSNVDKMMKSCATQPTSPYYFNATNGDQLKDAFADIAENLTSLHVSN